jgi:septal ring factor EnvC (AmiA/AmiB activator)
MAENEEKIENKKLDEESLSKNIYNLWTWVTKTTIYKTIIVVFLVIAFLFMLQLVGPFLPVFKDLVVTKTDFFTLKNEIDTKLKEQSKEIDTKFKEQSKEIEAKFKEFDTKFKDIKSDLDKLSKLLLNSINESLGEFKNHEKIKRKDFHVEILRDLRMGDLKK